MSADSLALRNNHIVRWHTTLSARRPYYNGSKVYEFTRGPFSSYMTDSRRWPLRAYHIGEIPPVLDHAKGTESGHGPIPGRALDCSAWLGSELPTVYAEDESRAYAVVISRS